MELATQVQIPDEVICASFYANALGKGIFSLHSPAIDN